MSFVKGGAGQIVLLAAVAIWMLPSVGRAETVTVDCDAGEPVQPRIDAARPGDSILVRGTCNENLEFWVDVTRVTLDGGGEATINGPDRSVPTIWITGRAITLTGLTITGGQAGIEVRWSGQADINGNTVQHTGGDGIIVANSSSALIFNNMIQENPGVGIVVGHSWAQIGIRRVADAVASPNVIRNNGRAGIVLANTSSAYIIGNTISDNGANGVGVTRVSYAEIASNTIDSNGGNGINVTGNSGVLLGADTGGGIRNQPNSTTANNGGFGIRCDLGGYADGRLGTLNGVAGPADFADSCIYSLIP